MRHYEAITIEDEAPIEELGYMKDKRCMVGRAYRHYIGTDTEYPVLYHEEILALEEVGVRVRLIKD